MDIIQLLTYVEVDIIQLLLTYAEVDIIQLLTYVEVDMECYLTVDIILTDAERRTV